MILRLLLSCVLAFSPLQGLGGNAGIGGNAGVGGGASASGTVPTYVQAASNTFWFSGSGVTEALTLSSNVTAGSAVIINIGWTTTTSSIVSVIDGNVASYSAITYSTGGTCANGTAGRVSSFYLANSAGGTGSKAITVTWGADPGYGSFAAQEWSGANTTTPVDIADCQYQLNPGTGSDAVQSPAVTTTATDGIMGFSFDDGIQSSDTWTAGTNLSFTIPGSATNPATNINEHGAQSSSGSAIAKFTINTGISNLHTVIVAVKH